MDDLPGYCSLLLALQPEVGNSTTLTVVAIKLIAVLFLVLANGFFVAAEFAFVAVRRSRIETLAASGNTSAALAFKQTVALISVSSRMRMKRQMPVLPPYCDHEMPSKSGVPGLSDVVIGE